MALPSGPHDLEKVFVILTGPYGPYWDFGRSWYVAFCSPIVCFMWSLSLYMVLIRIPSFDSIMLLLTLSTLHMLWFPPWYCDISAVCHPCPLQRSRGSERQQQQRLSSLSHPGRRGNRASFRSFGVVLQGGRDLTF